MTIQPRMMKRTTAAAYCDLSVAAFEREVAAITGQTFQVVEQYAAQVNRGKLGKAAILKWEKHRRVST